jgi:AGZA family xanthine/uracil permease-like MFS transporter
MYGVISFVVLKLAASKIKDISVVTWILFIVFILRFALK